MHEIGLTSVVKLSYRGNKVLSCFQVVLFNDGDIFRIQDYRLLLVNLVFFHKVDRFSMLGLRLSCALQIVINLKRRVLDLNFALSF